MICRLKFDILIFNWFINDFPNKKTLLNIENSLTFHLLSCYPIHIIMFDTIQSYKSHLSIVKIKMYRNSMYAEFLKDSLCFQYFMLLDVIDSCESRLHFYSNFFIFFDSDFYICSRRPFE